MEIKRYAIDGPWPGQLAIVPRPRGGDWLDDEVADWKKAGLDVVVSALTPEEVESMELGRELAEGQRQGVEIVSFSIPDRGTPTSVAGSTKVFRQLGEFLQEGKHVAIHCRQGIGRSSMIAATLLIQAGVAAHDAWRRIETARGCPVPDTVEQQAWVEQFTRNPLAETRGN